MNAPQALHPTDQSLHAYGLGKLDDASADSVNKHLESCPDCRSRVAAMSPDSFLGKLRDAQGRPQSTGPVVSSLAGMSMTDGGAIAAAPPPTSTLPPGLADHPDYQIIRELGRGGMGVVYLAENTLMGRKEVLKVVGSHLISRPGVLERFLREIRSAAKLHHNNIVAAYAALRLGESLVLTMEYVEGFDLARMVKAKGPLPVAHTCNFIYQAALGLQHAHDRSMVHRDIKPANLMLSREGKKPIVKVLDFGLAKVTIEGQADNALTREGQMLGTPDYIAPEQIRDAQSADIRADIYSLGCTFYYLLTGGPPFGGDNLWDLYQAHFSIDAEPMNLARPEVPVELAALVAKMMAKEPNKRFQTPGEVAQALVPFFKPTASRPSASNAEVSRVNSQVAPPESSGVGPAPRQPVTPATAPAPAQRRPPKTGADGVAWESLIEFKETEDLIEAVKPKAAESKPAIAEGPIRRPPWKRWPLIAVAAVFGLIALGIIITIRTKNSETKIIAPDDKPFKAVIDGVPFEYKPSRSDTKNSPPVGPGEGLTPKAEVVESRSKKDDPQESGFVPLFNGKDLSGWEIAHDTGGEWAVVGGVLEGKSNGGAKGAVLITQRQDFANFHLRVKFREDDHQERGGGNIEIRRTPVGDNRNGYLVCRGLWPTIGREQASVGSITKMTNHPYMRGLAWEKQAESVPVAANAWNTLDITAVRNRISTSVNGKKVAEYMDASGWYGSGGIAFVVWGNSVLQFQEIVIEVLPE